MRTTPSRSWLRNRFFEPSAPASGVQRPEERGFALLFVLLLAAGIAISMYMELPRIAFETQRNREELLMQRGHEYQRAVGLYLKKNQRYPARIEDLESTNNLRFLRRRYVDPMTGKDDWRIIHAGPGGMLTDSLVKRKAAPGLAATSPGMGPGMNSNSAGMAPGGSMNVDPGFGSSNATDPNQPPQVNVAVQRRASDRSLAGNTAGTPGAAGNLDPNAQPIPPSGQFPAQFPFQPGQQPPISGQPGQPGAAGFAQQPEGVIGEQPQTPGTDQSGFNPPVRPGMPGMPPGMPGMRPGFPPQPFNPAQQPVGGFNQQPLQNPPGLGQDPGTGAAGNPGINAINNQLRGQTSGLSGGNSNGAFSNGQTGGGIAGVASKFKGPSIKIYDEQQRYEKWEFVYDPKKDSALTKNMPQAGQAPTGLSDSTKPAIPQP